MPGPGAAICVQCVTTGKMSTNVPQLNVGTPAVLWAAPACTVTRINIHMRWTGTDLSMQFLILITPHIRT